MMKHIEPPTSMAFNLKFYFIIFVEGSAFEITRVCTVNLIKCESHIRQFYIFEKSKIRDVFYLPAISSFHS
jgi:hypothetical protein